MTNFLADERQKKQSKTPAPIEPNSVLAPPSQQTVQRAQIDPRQMTPADVSSLQRSIGNAAVANMLSAKSPTGAPAIQRKLQVGPANDEYEREADQVAASVQRASISHTSYSLQHDMAGPSVGMEGGTLDGDLENKVKSAKGSGSAMPKNVKSTLEGKLGADLSGVRVHTDQKAADLNRSMGAKAFTHGSDIFYGRGQSPSNLSLTAHETTHTIQQGAVKQVRTKRHENE